MRVVSIPEEEKFVIGGVLTNTFTLSHSMDILLVSDYPGHEHPRLHDDDGSLATVDHPRGILQRGTVTRGSQPRSLPPSSDLTQPRLACVLQTLQHRAEVLSSTQH